MRPSKFSEAQIVDMLREVDAGVLMAEVFRKHGISRATYYRWQARCANATVSELSRLRELAYGESEQENARSKRMYAELRLENAAVKDVLHRKL